MKEIRKYIKEIKKYYQKIEEDLMVDKHNADFENELYQIKDMVYSLNSYCNPL